MLLNRHRCLLKTSQLLRLICTEECLAIGRELSDPIKKFPRKFSTCKIKSKKKSTKNICENVDIVGNVPASTNSDFRSIEESLNVNVDNGIALPNVEETFDTSHGETKNKEEELEETHRKGCHVEMEDFMIRNMMSYPLYVPPKDRDSDASNPQSKSFPSVSTILNETMSNESRKFLEDWKCRMIAQMGKSEFLRMQKDRGKRARKEKLLSKGRKKSKIVVATLNRGTKFHHSLKQYLLGEDLNNISVDKEVEGCWNSVKTVLPNISDVVTVEAKIFHPHLYYRGILDCVASYKNVPCVIEWKQSNSAKKCLSSTYDAPIQVCAYMGALYWGSKVDPAVPVSSGLIVVAHSDGSPAEVFPMGWDFCESYWKQWLRRLQRYWLNRSPSLQIQAS